AEIAALTLRRRRNNSAPRTRNTQPPQKPNKEKPMEHDSVRCGNFAIGHWIPSLRHLRLQSPTFLAAAPWQVGRARWMDAQRCDTTDSTQLRLMNG
ncbi:hypothetical protein KXV77_000839, partial [Aspergillus fumigatus]